ncbi:hypothetical protein [Pararhodobacter sp.]|uniref:hypothetical protein n=1 Tax=Pararhodobacter sp. TaxID=2127056 RepID=UPI002AFF2547|nr:hypothetical protein [Pararhodobacter sp.]
MTENHTNIQPGPVFYDVFLGYLRVMGTNLTDWCVPHAVRATNAKLAATGGWNGVKARALRQKMIDEVGEETFARLYAERMRREVA